MRHDNKTNMAGIGEASPPTHGSLLNGGNQGKACRNGVLARKLAGTRTVVKELKDGLYI